MAKKNETKTIENENIITENLDETQVEVTDKKELEEITDENIVVPEKIVEGETIKEEDRPLDMHEYIPVKSLTEGSLSYTDEMKGIKYLWRRFGDVQNIPFVELQSMMAMYPSFFEDLNILVQDKRVIKKLNLGYIYQNIDMKIINDIDYIFSLSSDKIRQIINDLSENVKDNLKSRAYILVSEHKLTDLNIIKVLEDELQIDLRILD